MPFLINRQTNKIIESEHSLKEYDNINLSKAKYNLKRNIYSQSDLLIEKNMKDEMTP